MKEREYISLEDLVSFSYHYHFTAFVQTEIIIFLKMLQAILRHWLSGPEMVYFL